MRADPEPEVPSRAPPALPAKAAAFSRPQLEFDNGLGGFAKGGREYVIILGPGVVTPAPWINVIANERFGFQVSESGAGYTWSENSRENQLTAWSNDPVVDPPSEVLYIRDDETGNILVSYSEPGSRAVDLRRSPWIRVHVVRNEGHGMAFELGCS